MTIKKHLSFTSLREGLSSAFNKVVDWRQQKKVTISIHDALMSGFACMHFQDPSLLQFQKRMQEDQHRNNLETLFNVKDIPKETQMREIIDGVDSDYLRPIFKDFYLRLQRGKYLERYQIFPNLYYFPIDGSQFYSSEEVNCAQCLVKEHKEGCPTFSHQVLQGGIMHPDCSEVIPFMPEQIVNGDGGTKQDCEMNAAKRFIKKLRKDCPQLNLLIGGDALFSKQPIIEDVLSLRMHYLFAAKPNDHKYMMEWLEAYPKLNQIEFVDDKGRTHEYEWMNGVPLNGQKDSINVNFLRCTITGQNKKGKEEILYRNSWVTDLDILGGYDLLPMSQLSGGTCEKAEAGKIYIDEVKRVYLVRGPDGLPKSGNFPEGINLVNLNDNLNNEALKTKILAHTSKKGHTLTEGNVITLVKAGRCRWKNENECFNVMKNHGYCMEHNYGHGNENLAFNFYLLTLLAFFFHQIFELTDGQYQACRKKFGSKKHMWEKLRSWIDIIIFESWEKLLEFALAPKTGLLIWAQPP
jgi:hypothetical protein